MFKVSGFGELLPEQKIIEEKILDIIRNSYKQFGYTSIETPAVEKNTVLTAKGGQEVSKQIFGLYGLAQGCEKDKKDYSLHFDLTVPFARYILDHRHELTFPFKRNQIQKVWRGERAQKGRFREFYQADIDVIWDNNSNNKYLFYDAETIFTIITALERIFSSLNIDVNFFININHRKLIEGFLKELNLKNIESKIITLIDKKDKISEEDFINELIKLNIDKEKQGKILKFTNIETVNIDDIEKLNINNEDWINGINEIKYIISILKELGIKDKIKINLSIMRGLDYYTGIVFETFIEKERSLGSIASGGRYDNFTKYIDNKTSFSGVGGSIGISRLESYIFEQIETTQKTSTEYLLINFKETEKKVLTLYKKLLEQGYYIEYYPTADKLGKQFKYADKKGIRYCIILGEDELKKGKYQIKDMKTGEVFYNNL